MIDKSIKDILEKDNDLDFKPLYELMEQSGLNFVNQKLLNVFGIATYGAIYLDMDKLIGYGDESKYFVILHEMAHGKRIKKFGKQWIIDNLSIENFENFVDSIVHEEIIADRYACYMLYKLTKQSFPRYQTQQLHLLGHKERYKGMIQHLFGVVQFDEAKYDKLFETYIIND